MIHKSMRFILGALLSVTCFGNAWAQTAPKGPIRLVVGFAAGGANDVTARLIAPRLDKILGVPVIVENRAGANGILAAEHVAAAAADGNTLLVPANGMFTINPSLYRKLRYDPLKDFTAISRVVVMANVMAVHPSLPVKSVRELIRLDKTRPGQLMYGSGGMGGIPHLSGALFNSLAGTKMVHVPYKSGGQSTIGLLSGEVAVTFNTLITSIPHIRTGKLKALAVTTLKRSSQLANIPTVAESGVPGYESSTWYGLVAPAALPQGTLDVLSRSVAKMLAMSDLEKAFNDLGAEPTFDKPEQFTAVVKSDIAKWAKVVKEAGIPAE